MTRLAAMSRIAKDLGVVPEQVEATLIEQAEGKLGMRCTGCQQRIGVGFKFTRIDVTLHEGRPTVDVQYLSACNGADGCDFAQKARSGADVIEMVEFVWLHGDAPVGRGDLDADVAQAEAHVRTDADAEDEEFDDLARRAGQ
jgi:hypothetical protein